MGWGTEAWLVGAERRVKGSDVCVGGQRDRSGGGGIGHRAEGWVRRKRHRMGDRGTGWGWRHRPGSRSTIMPVKYRSVEMHC